MPETCREPDVVLADHSDATVVRHGAVVAKAHASGTDREGLTRRLAVAADPALRGILLAPLLPVPAELPGSARPVTLWPYRPPMEAAAPDRLPWEAAGGLLARLHLADTAGAAAVSGPLPPMRGPAKAAAAVARMQAAGPYPEAGPVLRAWAALPAWARGAAPAPRGGALCHGDLHFGQLVRGTSDGEWLLIDVDDLGHGDPAWDLARPAASYACGVLETGEWTRFLDAYRSCGGPAIPAAGDPWEALDVPARALTVQMAAVAVTKAVTVRRPLDAVDQDLVDACGRMAEVPVAGAGATAAK